TILGACKVSPQEFDNFSFIVIDIPLLKPDTPEMEKILRQILAEATNASNGELIAYRGNNRLVQTFERVHLSENVSEAEPLREKGVYLITGGLGGVGLLLADYLAQTLRARIVLTQRSPFPRKEDWGRWLADRGDSDPISKKIRRLQLLEECGAEVMLASADVADEEKMRSVIETIYERFGRLDGVIHAAGSAGENTIKLIHEVSRSDCESQFQGKAYGLMALDSILSERPPQFCLLM